LKRVKYYLWDTKKVSKYKETRNGLMGADFSSKLSPWMACGCVSPRYVYWETKNYEKRYKENESTKHFISELFWRDFCHWYSYRHGNSIFYEYGPFDKGEGRWRVDREIIQRWRQGLTGMPLVDALMREMNHSGFMSNRGRQIVASYFSLDLK
jgi:deoxyribodipyrimidine photo-lyase